MPWEHFQTSWVTSTQMSAASIRCGYSHCVSVGQPVSKSYLSESRRGITGLPFQTMLPTTGRQTKNVRAPRQRAILGQAVGGLLCIALYDALYTTDGPGPEAVARSITSVSLPIYPHPLGRHDHALDTHSTLFERTEGVACSTHAKREVQSAVSSIASKSEVAAAPRLLAVPLPHLSWVEEVLLHDAGQQYGSRPSDALRHRPSNRRRCAAWVWT